MTPVAVVGASAISAFGHSYRGLGQALLDRRLKPVPTRQLADSYPAVAGSEVVDIPRPENPAERNARKLMSRGALLGALAARALLRSQNGAPSGWTRPHLDLGYYLGVGASGGDMSQLTAMLHASLAPASSTGPGQPTSADSNAALSLSLERFGDAGLRRCNPLFAFQLMNNFSLCHGAILEDIRGPNAALFSRGSGTVAALIEAAHAIADGRCSRALAGGADSALHPVTYAELVRAGQPAVIPGEGAALLALQAGADDPIAWLLSCDFWPLQMGSESDSSLPLAALDAFLGAEAAPLMVVAPYTHSARNTLISWAKRRGASQILDVSTQLGESLAASPALAWVAALDLIASARASRALVVNAGPDGDLGAVLFGASATGSGPAHSQLRPRASISARPGDERIPVITGLGVVSAFGLGVDRFFEALTADRHAVGPIHSFDARTFPTRVAAQVPIDDEHTLAEQLAGHMRPGEERDRKLPFALAAALEAWNYAGCGPDEREAWLSLALGLEHALLSDFATIFAMGAHPRGRDARIEWNREPDLPLPDIRFRTPVDLAARAVRRELALTGKSVVHVSACAAGSLAIAHGASLIARGATSLVLCGGADSMINPLGLGGMSRLGAPSPRPDADACRPFDRQRDGLAMGEGAAIMVVESLARARARGARPLARILGWGSSQDGYKATAPRPDGSAAAAAMSRAIARAGCTGADIDYINAHGTGTPLNDPTEILAIEKSLSAAAGRVPISSVKGALGHLMAASGAVELAACLLAFVHDTVPGTAHLRELDPACRIAGAPAQVLSRAAPKRVQVALSNSFGFGGQNATLVIGRHE